MTAVEPIPLPRGWTKTVRSGALHAVALASVALTRAWGSALTGGTYFPQPARFGRRSFLDELTIRVKLWDGDSRYYQYYVQVATDPGGPWQTVVDRTTGEQRFRDLPVFTYSLPGSTRRHTIDRSSR